ncbi:hypothetical protein K490DRAFT_5800, partial [Saccharata proteae CBS 121410]
DEDDVDDYMNMLLAEPTTKPQKETSIQRRARLKREAEERSRPKPKKEREAEEAAAREAALATALPTSNKGFQMMAKLGFKQGDTLGKAEHARKEPITLEMKEERRGGIGLDSERKRKMREAFESEAKRTRAEEGDYWERLKTERETRRLEGQVIGAQKVAEQFSTEAEEDAESKDSAAKDGGHENSKDSKVPKTSHKPLKTINVLWRGVIRHRLEKEREKRMRYDLHQSLSRLPTYDDPDEDEEDERALYTADKSKIYEEEIEEEDPELEEFNALDPTDRLAKLVQYLRDTYQYCFWCKYRYPDPEMEGCPGLTEEDHD